MVLYDHQTNSYWSSVRHKAIKGKMAGTKLELLDGLRVTTWGAWKRQHPDTKVLTVRGVQSPGRDRYAGYHGRSSRGVRPVEHSNTRLPAKALVIGIKGKTEEKAFPMQLLPRGRIVTDTIDGRPLIVARTVATGQVVVWSGALGAAALRLPARTQSDLVVDRASKSTLDLVTGKFTAGPLQGKRLSAVEHTRLYWFVWADYYPKSKIGGLPKRAAGSRRRR